MKTELRKEALQKKMERIRRELPIEEAKEKTQLKREDSKPCLCGKGQIPNHDRYKYCDICRKTTLQKNRKQYRKKNLEQYKEYQRKYRERKRKPPHRSSAGAGG